MCLLLLVVVHSFRRAKMLAHHALMTQLFTAQEAADLALSEGVSEPVE